jgi:hypothetical protein
MWKVREDEESDGRNKDCDCGLDDEEPAPGSDTPRAIESVLDTCADETAEAAG